MCKRLSFVKHLCSVTHRYCHRGYGVRGCVFLSLALRVQAIADKLVGSVLLLASFSIFTYYTLWVIITVLSCILVHQLNPPRPPTHTTDHKQDVLDCLHAPLHLHQTAFL